MRPATRRRIAAISHANLHAGIICLIVLGCPDGAAWLAALALALAIAQLLGTEPATVNSARGLRADLDQATARLRELTAELEQAYTDPVTGLATRREVEMHLTGAAANGRQLTVVLTDVDDLHEVNNRHGHDFGDAYLAAIAGRLAGTARPGDLVGRFGGDEFVLFTDRLPEVVAGALAAALRGSVMVDGTLVPVRVSVGVCRCGGDAHAALGRADLAMFTAKRRRSGIEVYDPERDGIPQPRGARPAVRHRDRRV
jgi:diguanylate cyclase (GGDEF)-like protein